MLVPPWCHILHEWVLMGINWELDSSLVEWQLHGAHADTREALE